MHNIIPVNSTKRSLKCQGERKSVRGWNERERSSQQSSTKVEREENLMEELIKDEGKQVELVQINIMS